MIEDIVSPTALSIYMIAAVITAVVLFKPAVANQIVVIVEPISTSQGMLHKIEVYLLNQNKNTF